MRKLVIGLVVIVLILGAGSAAYFITKSHASKTSIQNPPSVGIQTTVKTPTSNTKQSDCPAVLFDTLPLALSDFRAFRPLGFLAPPVHIFGAKHSSFAINLPGEHVSGKPIHFPGNATVTLITTVYGDQKGYQVTFYPCSQVKSYLFHLGTISERLLAEVTRDEGTCQEFNFGTSKTKKCELTTKIAVTSGELAGGSDSFGGVDWGIVDYRFTNTFVNPDRYDGDYPHYTTPLNYMKADIRAQLESKVGSFDGLVKRTDPPIGGSLLQDVAGTAQGNWFTGGQSFKTTNDFSLFLALVHDYIDTKQPVFSMGKSVNGVSMGLYSFTPADGGLINQDFDQVKPGNIYCYEKWLSGTTKGGLPLGSLNGVLLLHMPDAKTLKVEMQTGSCGATTHISASATTFER